MYFKKTRCPNCQGLHDEMLDYCPFCGVRNEEHSEFKRRHPMTFIPWYRELMLFLIGCFGLIVFSLVFSLAFRDAYQADKELGEMLINTASYLSLFIILLIVLFPYFRDIFNKFKNPFSYMWAGIGIGALLVFSYAYSIIITILLPDVGTGANQTAVSNMVVRYPLISILIIGVIGPICEELAYRVGLFTLLRRIHPSVAYIGTALIFGFIHFDFTSADMLTEFVYLANYIFAGLCFSFIYEKGGFTASLLAHISNNIYSILMIFLASILL